MTIKGVIFDLDGTLLHTIEDIGDAANTLFVRHGYPKHSTDEFISWIGNGATKFIEQGIGSVINTEQLTDYVNEFKEVYGKNLTNKTRLYDGVREMLDKLSQMNITMAILSNKPHDLTVKVSDHFLSEWNINPVFGQREGIPRKPDPSAALELAEIMELKPETILFVGDSEGDVKTAEAAGMVPVFVAWGYGKENHAVQNGHPVAKHPSEIITLVNS